MLASRAAVEVKEVAQAAKAAADSEERRPQEAHSQQLWRHVKRGLVFLAAERGTCASGAAAADL